MGLAERRVRLTRREDQTLLLRALATVLLCSASCFTTALAEETAAANVTTCQRNVGKTCTDLG